MANNNVNKEQLKADIEKIKNAKTEKEVDAILAKYKADLEAMENAKKAKKEESKTQNKQEPKTTTKKSTLAASKQDVKKQESAPKNKQEPKATAKKTTEKNNTQEPEKKGRQYNGKYEVYQVGDGVKYNLKASNGEILVSSEVYTSRDGVIKAIDAIKRNVETGEIRVFADKHGNYKFKLTALNHRVIAISAHYSTEKSAQRASESFKKFALSADIVDVEVKDVDEATLVEVTRGDDKDGGKFEWEKFNDEYSWDLKASNGQILCQAEGYTSKSGLLNSIEVFKKNVNEGIFKVVKDKNNQYMYKLYTSNGRVCAVGESYSSKASAESAANSVCSFINKAEIVELKEDKN